MSEKEQVVIEVIRNEGPLTPAPPALNAEADLDAILQVLKAKAAPAEPEPAAPGRTMITLDLAEPGELGLEEQARGLDATSMADPSVVGHDGLLDLGIDGEQTQADARPMVEAEQTQADARPMLQEEKTLDDASAMIADALARTDLDEAPIPLREAQPLGTAEAAEAPIPLREVQPEPGPEATEAPIPLREVQPESEAGEVAPIAAANTSEYTGDGSIVEVESEAQREAREEKEKRLAARDLAESMAKAEILAKAEAEAEAIKVLREEIEAKKQKREEARLARKLEAQDDDSPDRVALAKNVQERIRGLSAAEQQKLARNGDQRERVVLERLYGKNVWEALLRNPKLTPPEAARIARMGGLPVPLIEIIVSNRSFLSSSQVRRALFTNPRLKKDMLMTVLRATPKPELKLIPKQTAYPHAVRQAAKRLLT